MKGSFLGPKYSNDYIRNELNRVGAKYQEVDDDELIFITTEELKNNSAIGWFQGRMEFGPRALGSRSIIANPKSDSMQKTLNLKIKYRESFRPFAPSILREDLNKWFDFDIDSPYMLFVSQIKESLKIKNLSDKNLFGIEKLNSKRSVIPAVTHVDFSARIQTVHFETNPLYHKLISSFKKRTGCPILVNTSFNVRGEPIVCNPADAFNCFMGTELDYLIIGNCVLEKVKQDSKFKKDYSSEFELD